MEQTESRMGRWMKQGMLFLKWLLYSAGIGLLVGGVAAAFHLGIDWAAELRAREPWILWLLPVGGMAIVLLYRVCRMEKDQGTNLVLAAVREAEPLKLRTAPLIFLSTIVTHLVGGSAGREGAALQLGGSLAAWVGREIRLDAKDSRVMVMCGMSAAFSALFGTPLTAVCFSMEVVSVGVMYYAALVPCVVASLTALQVAQGFGLHQSPGYEIGRVLAPSPWCRRRRWGSCALWCPSCSARCSTPPPSCTPNISPIPCFGLLPAERWCWPLPCWWAVRTTMARGMG